MPSDEAVGAQRESVESAKRSSLASLASEEEAAGLDTFDTEAAPTVALRLPSVGGEEDTVGRTTSGGNNARSTARRKTTSHIAREDSDTGKSNNLLPGAALSRKSVRTSTQGSDNSKLAPSPVSDRSGSKTTPAKVGSKTASDFGTGGITTSKSVANFRNSVRLVSTTNKLSLGLKKGTSEKDINGGSSSSKEAAKKLMAEPGQRRERRLTTMPATIGQNDKELPPLKPKKLPEEEVLATKEDAWDMLLIDESGQRQRNLTVGYLAEVWDGLRLSGLDASLSHHLRLNREGEKKEDDDEGATSPTPKQPSFTAKDVGGAHVKVLCTMFLADPDLEEFPTDEDEVENFLFQLQMDVDINKDVDMEARVNFKNFRKLIHFSAHLLNLEDSFIVMQIVWLRENRFEMNCELHSAIAEIAKWKDAACEFKRNQLDILVHSSGILHKTKKAGSALNWGNFHQQFDKFLLQKLDLLKERQDKKNKNKPQEHHETFAKGFHPNDSVCGRTEFGLWLETLFAYTNKSIRVYQSPLAMCVEWIRTARMLGDEDSEEEEAEGEEVADPTAAAQAKAEVDLALKEFKKQKKEAETLKDQFKRLDLNSNGSLDFSEFCSFLLQGTPHLSGKELRGLFKSADSNGDGMVVFEEFVDFIHSSEQNDNQPGVPEGVRVAFKAYCKAGEESNMDSFHFTKILKDAKLVDKDLPLADVDIIFNRMRNPQEKRLGLPQFERALKQCAEKKGIDLGEVYEAIWAVPIVVREPREPSPAVSPRGDAEEGEAKSGWSLRWLKGGQSAKELPQRLSGSGPPELPSLSKDKSAPTLTSSRQASKNAAS